MNLLTNKSGRAIFLCLLPWLLPLLFSEQPVEAAAVGSFQRTFAERGTWASKLCGNPQDPPVPSYEDCVAAIREGQPTPDRAIYYTGLSQRQRESVAGWIVYDTNLQYINSRVNDPVWDPPNFTDKEQYSGTQAEKRRFWEDFSRVFAERSSGRVYIVLQSGQFPPINSIFYRIEFPAMRDGGQVTEIIRIDYEAIDYYMKAQGRIDPRDPAFTSRWWRQGDPDPPAARFDWSEIV